MEEERKYREEEEKKMQADLAQKRNAVEDKRKADEE